MKITLVDARERIAERYKPGGDKYESIKADEEWEKANEEPLSCSCEVLAPCEYCVENDLE